ncbi:MAG: matrixin family metalloprotease [Cyanobacteria bacterium REEB67]|nr:matrixin family metalloprotease [Cyanobacteria bacterium REEB67]
MKSHIRKCVLATLVLSSLVVCDGGVLAKEALSAAAMTPLQLVQSGRYVQALPAFKKMALQSPGDASINYYLGLCAMSAREYDLAEASFCKVVAGTPPASPFVPLAQHQLQLLPHKYAPQCALTNGKLYHWQKGQQLKVYISDGCNVPGTGMGVLSSERYAQTVAAARNSMASQPMVHDYKQGDQTLVLEGIKAWDWAVREKYFSYTFVRDPKLADIIVMFTEQPNGCTLYPFAAGQPVLSWASIGSAGGENTSEEHANHVKMIMAHEFGHCLGLWHASGKMDLMLPIIEFVGDKTREAPDAMTSENDKASLRALYALPADMIL